MSSIDSWLGKIKESASLIKKKVALYVRRLKKQMTCRIICIGAHVTSLITIGFFSTIYYSKKGLLFLWNRTSGIRAVLMLVSMKLAEFISRPFRKMNAIYRDFANRVKDEYNNTGIVQAIKYTIKQIIGGIWGRRGAFVVAFNYTAPIVCIVFLFNLVGFASNVSYIVNVSFDGVVVGYVENENIYDEAEEIMQKRITYMDGNSLVELNPTLSVERSKDTETIDAYELADILLKHTNVEVEDAYGLYIDNEFYGAVLDKGPIEDTLESLLDKYRENKDDEVEFAKKITFASGLYVSESIKDAQLIIPEITKMEQENAYYTVKEGDAPTSIADKLDIPYKELKALNSDIEENLPIGRKLLINREKPFLDVNVTRVEKYDTSIKYETIEVKDSNKYKGVKTVINDGKQGKARITAKVTYTNGYETSRTVLEKKVVSEPVAKKVSVGTRDPLPNVPHSTASAGSKMFIWPVGGGKVSSSYGYRWGSFHKGLDIAAPYGTPIYAGASGTVVSSGWYGDYGKQILIDHGGGVVTRYAHCSSLSVSAGEKVIQGQYIGAIGRTGYSTGNHLHFEVIVNNSHQNPVNYINR